MNAFEFVKKHGWEAVIEAVKSTTAEETAAFESTDLDPILAKDGSVIGFNVKVYAIPYVEVKSLVESYEIVSKFESIADAKEAINNAPEAANEFRKLSCGTRYIKVGPRFFEYWDGSKWCRPTVPFTEENHILRFTPLARLDQAIADVESVGGGV
ncbi:hypothetical protein GJV03_08085 [Acinetobacter sp. RIT698]|uniref:hypothetical protein n=1 Tax=Acinetobacter sp. RIT698 TaxID=2666192 RepID=UPI0012AC7B1F|nr:hypothetical protein [Acinetobacter sp. RIT698]MRT37117.1 hypothetical protein [Acinetobacter sp. RIT698]